MKMMPRGCQNPFCDAVFKVAYTDYTTKFHSSFCKENFEERKKRGSDMVNDPRIELFTQTKSQKCLDMVNLEKMENSTMEDGEVKSSSLPGKRSNELEKDHPNTSHWPEREENKELNQIQTLKSARTEDQKKDITETESMTLKEENNGSIKTKSDNSPIKGNIMNKTSQPSGPESMPIGLGENHLEESKSLSTVLKKEKDNSIQSLNESSRLLVGLAKLMMEGKRDDEGNFIQKPSLHDIDTALKCAEGARNIQKTKLDYLKFGHELGKA